MRSLSDIKSELLWKYYYKYRSIGERDGDGGYAWWQKLLMAANYTKVSLVGEYWTPERLAPSVCSDGGRVGRMIYDVLSREEPCMIARFGANEQRVVANWLSITGGRRSLWGVVSGRQPYWWWNKMVRRELHTNAGFFPNETAFVERYARRMVADARELDVLLTWYGWEPLLVGDGERPRRVSLYEAEPWWEPEPWTRALRGRRVLVVHPFARLIERQYERRRELFANADILPDFELQTLEAVQSIAGEATTFGDWFEALEWMEREMDRREYDIALIGCGAYGFCLAAHARRTGHRAFHLGGVLQLLFGIKGSRWESGSYHPRYDYRRLFNDSWVRPGEGLRPQGAGAVEGGCYW